jgi:hypothetical protein
MAVARRFVDNFLWWLDGLPALYAVGGYFLVSLLTAVLLATVGDAVGAYVPFLVALGLFIVHCARRPQGGWDVFGIGTGPGALVGILKQFVSLPGVVLGILGVVALAVSLFLAWAYDHQDADEPTTVPAG